MKIDQKKLKILGQKVLEEVGLNKSAEVGLFFVTDRKIKKLNKKFRKINKPTDVLSFPVENIKCSLGKKIKCMPEFPGKLVLGDVVISEKTAKKQARLHKHSFKTEIEFLFVHGVLHLVGLDHEKGKKEEKAWDDLVENIFKDENKK